MSHESPGCCCIRATLEQYHGYIIQGYVMATLWLSYAYVMAVATVAASARREAVYGCCVSQEKINMLQFLLLLESSSLLDHVLPTLGSVNRVNTVNSKTTSIMNRTNKTIPLLFSWLKISKCLLSRNTVLSELHILWAILVAQMVKNLTAM